MIAADELQSRMETAHLLRSPKNAERLLSALARARAADTAPTSVDAKADRIEFLQGRCHC